jgi:hypothetical protein
MENKRGFHVTIVKNQTGETLEEFDTKGMVYVHLNEVDEAEATKGEEQAVAANGIGVGQKTEGVNPFERLALLEGLQILIQNMQEDDPMLQLLMMITETKRKAGTSRGD